MISRFSRRDYAPSPLLRTVQIILLALIVIGIALLLTQKMWVPKLVDHILKDEFATVTFPPVIEINNDRNPYDGTYIVNGTEVTLVGGINATEVAPGSASKVVTKYFGNEAYGDIDGDGTEDTAFLLTQETGGSGTFFYVTAQLNTADGVRNIDATLIGDRIAPQPMRIENGLVMVQYADRAPGESFDTQPSVGKTLRLKLDPASLQFGEVVANFEGEANPASMSLTMGKWVWQSAQYEDGRTVTPTNTGRFTLTFTPEGTFSASTDCNGVGGTYTTSTESLTFTDMMSTLMYCEDSQEDVFRQLLTNTQGYHFTTKGELVLHQKYDSGTMLFRGSTN